VLGLSPSEVYQQHEDDINQQLKEAKWSESLTKTHLVIQNELRERYKHYNDKVEFSLDAEGFQSLKEIEYDGRGEFNGFIITNRKGEKFMIPVSNLPPRLKEIKFDGDSVQYCDGEDDCVLTKSGYLQKPEDFREHLTEHWSINDYVGADGKKRNIKVHLGSRVYITDKTEIELGKDIKIKGGQFSIVTIDNRRFSPLDKEDLGRKNIMFKFEEGRETKLRIIGPNTFLVDSINMVTLKSTGVNKGFRDLRVFIPNQALILFKDTKAPKEYEEMPYLRINEGHITENIQDAQIECIGKLLTFYSEKKKSNVILNANPFIIRDGEYYVHRKARIDFSINDVPIISPIPRFITEGYKSSYYNEDIYEKEKKHIIPY